MSMPCSARASIAMRPMRLVAAGFRICMRVRPWRQQNRRFLKLTGIPGTSNYANLRQCGNRSKTVYIRGSVCTAKNLSCPCPLRGQLLPNCDFRVMSASLSISDLILQRR